MGACARAARCGGRRGHVGPWAYGLAHFGPGVSAGVSVSACVGVDVGVRLDVSVRRAGRRDGALDVGVRLDAGLRLVGVRLDAGL